VTRKEKLRPLRDYGFVRAARLVCPDHCPLTVCPFADLRIYNALRFVDPGDAAARILRGF
ncbi:MAG TPA: hypothetical protein PK156_19565, partial [Polyangium sp.]|nr:hypothetical protein [Polyangium sp.]